MRGHKSPRVCKVCGTVYTRRTYGWCCSHACQQVAEYDGQVSPRAMDRFDCCNYKLCRDEAALQPRAYVCGASCKRYEPKRAEPSAPARLQSSAWMWEEA